MPNLTDGKTKRQLVDLMQGVEPLSVLTKR